MEDAPAGRAAYILSNSATGMAQSGRISGAGIEAPRPYFVMEPSARWTMTGRISGIRSRLPCRRRQDTARFSHGVRPPCSTATPLRPPTREPLRSNRRRRFWRADPGATEPHPAVSPLGSSPGNRWKPALATTAPLPFPPGSSASSFPYPHVSSCSSVYPVPPGAGSERAWFWVGVPPGTAPTSAGVPA
jgi:hypothetical protein